MEKAENGGFFSLSVCRNGAKAGLQAGGGCVSNRCPLGAAVKADLHAVWSAPHIDCGVGSLHNLHGDSEDLY
jgi:hypothetical protein